MSEQINRESRFKFYSSPTVKQTSQQSFAPNTSVTSTSSASSSNGNQTQNIIHSSQQQQMPSYQHSNQSNVQNSLFGHSFSESSLEEKSIQDPNISIPNIIEPTPSKNGDQSSSSNLDDILKVFRKELDSIKSMEVYSPARQSINTPALLRAANSMIHSDNNAPSNNASSNFSTSSFLSKLKEEASKGYNNIPITSTSSDVLKQPNHYPSTDNLIGNRINSNNNSFSNAGTVHSLTLQRSNGNNNSLSGTSAMNQSSSNVVSSASFPSSGGSSTLTTELRVENMQLRNEVSKLSATVLGLQARMDAMEKNFERMLQMIIEQSKRGDANL